MKDNNLAILILGSIFSIAVITSCIYGALNDFGVHVGRDMGNFMGAIVLFIPALLVSGIIFLIIDKFFCTSSESLSIWLYLLLVLLIWGTIVIQAIF